MRQHSYLILRMHLLSLICHRAPVTNPVPCDPCDGLTTQLSTCICSPFLPPAPRASFTVPYYPTVQPSTIDMDLPVTPTSPLLSRLAAPFVPASFATNPILRLTTHSSTWIRSLIFCPQTHVTSSPPNCLYESALYMLSICFAFSV